MRKLVAASLTCAMLIGIGSIFTVLAAGPTTRTVYVTVVDGQGHAVEGLTPADLAVIEGGKPRTITSVARASEKVRLALMVEQILVGHSYVRIGLADFVARMRPSAEIALFTVSQRAEKLVDYTSDPAVLIDGICNLPVGQTRQSGAVPDAIYEVAKQFEKARPARPAIVLAVIEAGQSTDNPESVLSQIAKSKAQIWAVSLSISGAARSSYFTRQQVVGREQVIGDGSVHSGGRRIPLVELPGFHAGLQQVADDLEGQYLITYTLPDGVKPSDRVSVSLEKPNATLRAPKRVPK
jgi:VWFA-related protein